jgi:arsenite methyltransferase
MGLISAAPARSWQAGPECSKGFAQKVSDVVARGQVPAQVRRHFELWSGCIAGALEESDYRARLEAAGFEAIDVEPTRIYSAAQCSEWFAQAGLDTDGAAPELDGIFMSAFVRARKPVR